MEANFFRFLATELAAALPGGRIEKVHGPAGGVLILTLYGRGRKSHLAFRPAKSAGLLFLSPTRAANPDQAPARVMWLRKRLNGRKIGQARMDWPRLRLAFELSPRDLPGAGRWLVFDLRDELTLAEDFPLPPQPVWPELPRLLDDPEVWREFPQATPPLRAHMAALARRDPTAAAALLARLAAGRADGFFLPADGAKAASPLVWPPTDDPALFLRFDTALEAARAHGERALYDRLNKLEAREDVDRAAAAKRRLKRQLALLDRDEARHNELAALAIPAEALQIALSTMKHTPRAESVTLEHPANGPVAVPLDPRLTPAENMARLFKLAAKGRRGLEHVARRRADLLAGVGPEVLPAGAGGLDAARGAPPPAPTLPKRYQGLAVVLFRTSDGFLALRGKSSQANHAILSRAASPHDYWLHVAGGPSAHVILRRDYPDQPVPERSLTEAAILCALKSYRKDDAKAEVLVARVKDVRKVKGAAMGSVAVDEVERTILVTLDPALEERLRVELGAPPPGR